MLSPSSAHTHAHNTRLNSPKSLTDACKTSTKSTHMPQGPNTHTLVFFHLCKYLRSRPDSVIYLPLFFFYVSFMVCLSCAAFKHHHGCKVRWVLEVTLKRCELTGCFTWTRYGLLALTSIQSDFPLLERGTVVKDRSVNVEFHTEVSLLQEYVTLWLSFF